MRREHRLGAVFGKVRIRSVGRLRLAVSGLHCRQRRGYQCCAPYTDLGRGGVWLGVLVVLDFARDIGAVPARLQAPNTVRQWRVGREQLPQAVADLAEENV